LNTLESSKGEESSVSILRNKKLIFGCEHFELNLDRHEAKQTYGTFSRIFHDKKESIMTNIDDLVSSVAPRMDGDTTMDDQFDDDDDDDDEEDDDDDIPLDQLLQRQTSSLLSSSSSMPPIVSSSSASSTTTIVTSSVTTETAATKVSLSLVGSSSSAAAARQPPLPAMTRATTTTPPATAAATTVIARPPINVYLKMAVLRDMTDDGITCEDPEQVGRRKYIAMSQLHHPQQPQQQQQQQDREGGVAAVNEDSVAVSGCSQQLQRRQCTQVKHENIESVIADKEFYNNILTT
jgi:hypothetical protein